MKWNKNFIEYYFINDGMRGWLNLITQKNMKSLVLTQQYFTKYIGFVMLHPKIHANLWYR